MKKTFNSIANPCLQLQGGQANCPVGGICNVQDRESEVYKATVRETASGKTETYTGFTGREFKKKLCKHRAEIICNTAGKNMTRLHLRKFKIFYNLLGNHQVAKKLQSNHQEMYALF